MNQRSLLFRTVSFLALALQITSCQKILDHWPGHGHGQNDDDSTINYRIKSMKYSSNHAPDPSRVSEAIFHYGAGNRLDSIISTGDPDYKHNWVITFIYGLNGRLLRYFATYDQDGNSGVVSDNYGYDNNDRVVFDTLSNSFFVTGYVDLSSLRYNAHGQIISDFFNVVADGFPQPADTLHFAYDADGNRGVVTGDSQLGLGNNGTGNTDSALYDDKVAYRSTNSIFQLIDRDYSNNNSSFAIGYNSAGLPLGFSSGSTEEFLELGEPREIQWEQVSQ